MNSFRLSTELVNELDKYEDSPNKIAERILPKLSSKQISNYELLCFCVEFIALEAQNNLRYLLIVSKALSKVFYFSHYMRAYERHKSKLPKELIASLQSKEIRGSSPSENAKEGDGEVHEG